ncbi:MULTISPECIES: hypothetical protein [unclassified Streptococcus]|uniref:hypothetical protein n=1 Tax=unclassified Streptococcus TaxID=2608887 RepID=UPI00359E490B
MTRPRHLFPLVADDEPVIKLARVMSLYENEDVITNIKGNYQDKIYADEVETAGEPAGVADTPPTTQPVFEPAEKGRQEARADLKKKRQALLTREMPIIPKSKEPVSSRSQARVATNKPIKGWGDYAKALRQDAYILAELPQLYQEPVNASAKEPKKNNYDFLKRSQIYNQDAIQRQKEQRVAQELNLSRLEGQN